jgi:hypothetical protein
MMITQFNGIYGNKINLVDDLRAGFSFQGGLFRVKNYRVLEGGFANFTKNVSYGRDGILAEKMISVYYY